MTRHDTHDTHDHDALLTPRQREVVSLLARGLAQKQVAKRLGISAETVKNHVAHALTAVGCQDIVGLTALYWGGEVAYPLAPARHKRRSIPGTLPLVQDQGDRRMQPPWATLTIPARPAAEEIVASRLTLDKELGCWLWNGPVAGSGGARLCIGPKGPSGRRRAVMVRRWLYEREYGPLPADLYLYRTCRSPRCVNPRPGHARVARSSGGIVVVPARHVLDGWGAAHDKGRAEASRTERPLGDDDPLSAGTRLRVCSRGSHLDGDLVTVTRCYRMPRFDNWPADKPLPWVYRVHGVTDTTKRSSMGASQLRTIDDTTRRMHER